MPDSPMEFLYGLLRASALLSAGFVVVWILLRSLKIRSLRVHRLCWTVVLLQGVIVLPISVELPVLAPVENFDYEPVASRQIPAGPIPQTFRRDLPPREINVSASKSLSKSGPPRHNAATIFLYLWVSGIAVVVMAKVLRYMAFVRQVSNGVCDDAPPEWIEHWQAACEDAGLSRPVALCVTRNIGPCICWMQWETRLLIPGDQWSELTDSQRDSVLRHELAHITRRDLWTGLLIQSLACVQWFNPLAWLCVRKLAECSEWACDDAVRRQSADGVSEYVKALLEFSVTVHRVPAFVTSASAHSVVLRARRLLNPTVMEDSRMKKLTMMIAVITLLAVGMLNPKPVAMAAQDDSAGNNNPTTPVAASSEADSKTDDTVAPAANSEHSTPDPDPEGSVRTSVDLTLEPASVTGQLMILDDDPARLTHRIRLLTEPAQQRGGTREAVVDMNYLFKHLPEFKRQRDALQERVKMEDERIRAETKAIQVIARQLKEVSLTDREALETQVAERHARINALRTVAKKRFTNEEAKIYAAVYRRIRKAIAEHAQENGIDIVRRAAMSREHQERLDSEDPKIVLQALNADVLYVADDGKIDITDAVLKRLTEDSVPSESPKP